MEKAKLRKIMLFGVAILAILIRGLVAGKSRSENYLETERQLNRLNTPAVKSIKVGCLTEDGGVIDCVDIYKQPAFGDPLLKNHTIQMRPSDYPEGKVGKASPRSVQQTWQKSGSCPEGTVPIRRTTKNDLMIRPVYPYISGKEYENGILEVAGASVNNRQYYGTTFDVGVWNIDVQSNEFSMAAVFIANNDNWITVGWKIMQRQFGDNRTRFFTYWTADGGHKTGCYNLLCWGFIQVDHTIVLGDFLSSVSTYDGADYYLPLTVYLDRTNNKWWLGIFDVKWVGYWPLHIFSNLNGASRIHWTGQVLNTESGGYHTFTKMGSGHFSSEGYRKAAYFANMYVMDDKNTYQQPYGAKSYASRPGCYDVEDITYDDSDNGNHFFYGGPGFGVTCP